MNAKLINDKFAIKLLQCLIWNCSAAVVLNAKLLLLESFRTFYFAYLEIWGSSRGPWGSPRRLFRLVARARALGIQQWTGVGVVGPSAQFLGRAEAAVSGNCRAALLAAAETAGQGGLRLGRRPVEVAPYRQKWRFKWFRTVNIH